jgi:hypothetical protein
LSGCPSVTDSEEKRKSVIAMPPAPYDKIISGRGTPALLDESKMIMGMKLNCFRETTRRGSRVTEALKKLFLPL